ncbi:MAG: hypothetical protein AAGD22_17980 [Verrucomicrobiota bacterium]
MGEVFALMDGADDAHIGKTDHGRLYSIPMAPLYWVWTIASWVG